ncbi:hypothetical protein M7M4_09080 [Corynebacterium pseudogenitalium]
MAAQALRKARLAVLSTAAIADAARLGEAGFFFIADYFSPSPPPKRRLLALDSAIDRYF